MGNFVYDGTAVYGEKTNVKAVANEATQVTAANLNLISDALADIRTAILAGAVNAQRYEVVGDGVADDTVALQAAITASAGRTLYLPKGKYKVTSTLFITSRSHHIVGDFANRDTENGTEISYTGTGPCIQIGTDSGNPWSDNEYNGLQDHRFENLCIRHGAPDTALIAAGDAVLRVKLGAYGIWDWRGGGITMHRCTLEHFEANFVGIQSDINTFSEVKSSYSKYGIYVGPRSDQNTFISQESIFCDRAITIDRAGGTRVICGQFVGCGHSTAASIEIRRGSGTGPFGVAIEKCWFETNLGYQGTDKLSFVSVGEIDGYGAGGSIQSGGGSAVTGAVVGCKIEDPQLISIIGGSATHVKYLASVGKCQQFILSNPNNQNSGSLTNFDALVGIQASQAPTNSDTQIAVFGVSSSLAIAKIFTNLGAGTPDVYVQTSGASGAKWYATQRFSFATHGAAAGADEVRISQEGNVGEIWLSTPNKPTGQTTRLRLARSRQTTFAGTGPPTSGTYEVGDRVDILDATQTGYTGFYCWIAGTPGTWSPYGKIEGRELIAPSLSANQDNYSPSSMSSTRALILTASVPVNITGIATGTSVAGSASSTGKELLVYNDGAQNITLTHQDAASTAANRIIGTGNANVVLTPATGCLLCYSPSKTRWLVMAHTL